MGNSWIRTGSTLFFGFLLIISFQNCGAPQGLELSSEENSGAFALTLKQEDPGLPEGPMAGDSLGCKLHTSNAIQGPGQEAVIDLQVQGGVLPNDIEVEWLEYHAGRSSKAILQAVSPGRQYKVSYRKAGIRQFVAYVRHKGSQRQLCRSTSVLLRAESYECRFEPSRLVVARNENVRSTIDVSPQTEAARKFKFQTEVVHSKMSGGSYLQEVVHRDQTLHPLTKVLEVTNTNDEQAGFYRHFVVVVNEAGEEICRTTSRSFRLLTSAESNETPRTQVSEPRDSDGKLIIGIGSGGNGSGGGGNGNGNWNSNSDDECLAESFPLQCDITTLSCSAEGRTTQSYSRKGVRMRLNPAPSTAVVQPVVADSWYTVLTLNYPYTCIGVDSIKQDDEFKNYPGILASGWFPSATILSRCSLQSDERPGKRSCSND